MLEAGREPLSEAWMRGWKGTAWRRKAEGGRTGCLVRSGAGERLWGRGRVRDPQQHFGPHGSLSFLEQLNLCYQEPLDKASCFQFSWDQ